MSYSKFMQDFVCHSLDHPSYFFYSDMIGVFFPNE